jgi:hypothetical protein
MKHNIRWCPREVHALTFALGLFVGTMPQSDIQQCFPAQIANWATRWYPERSKLRDKTQKQRLHHLQQMLPHFNTESRECVVSVRACLEGEVDRGYDQWSSWSQSAETGDCSGTLWGWNLPPSQGGRGTRVHIPKAFKKNHNQCTYTSIVGVREI